MHLRVNEHGLPLQIELSPGQAHDAPMAELLLQDLPKGTSLLADRGYDADWIREMIEDQNCTPVIPPKSNRREEIPFSKRKYKKRNLVERCINKPKQFRHIATRTTGTLQLTSPLQSLVLSGSGSGFMSPQPRHQAEVEVAPPGSTTESNRRKII
jgi:transposase